MFRKYNVVIFVGMFIGLGFMLPKSTLAFDYVMGSALYPHHTPVKPAKGASIIDPNFHTKITRLTDGETEVPGAGIRLGYGTYRVSNSNAQYLLFIDRKGDYRIHYATPPYQTFRIIDPDYAELEHEEPEYRWDGSGDHPNWLYWRRFKQLMRMDINTGESIVVHDFMNDRVALEDGSVMNEDDWNNAYIANFDAGTVSKDSRYWIFGLYTSNGNGKTYHRIFVYDKTMDQVVSAKNIDGGRLNEVYMSPDGEYVYIGFNGCAPWNSDNPLCGGWMYKRDLSNWGDPDYFMCSIPPHTNWMYDAQGYLGMFYPNNQTDHLTFKRAVNGFEWKIRRNLEGEGADWGRGNKHHGAMPGPERKGWGMVATYTVKYNDHQGWEDDAVYLVEVDENKYAGGPEKPRIWRIADLNNDSTVNYYFNHPNASMNYEGTKIWFGSNWDTTDGTPDVYQIDLPETWYEDLNGGGSGSVCDSAHLNLCTTQVTCEAISAHWCDNACQSEECVAPVVIRADVNQVDGITATDALLTLKKAVGFSLENLINIGWQNSTTTGDVNCDGGVSAGDALLILKYAVGANMDGTDWCE